MFIPLILGDFVFDEQSLETPEILADLAGHQIVQQHDFPGGYRTQQSFGYFPGAVRWKGRFSSGDASDRVEAVKRILFAGQEVQLTWGERAWLGRLVKFAPAGRHTWLFDYDCEFWPRVDISSGQGESDGEPDPNAVLDLQLLALESILVAGPETFYPLVLPILAGPILDLITVVNAALLAASGVVAIITHPEQFLIQAAATALAIACAPLQAVIDATISSPAWDIASRALIIGNVISSANATRWVVSSINPNLMVLSAQYYSDASQWRRIAFANGLTDPQPIGDFTLVIPAP